MTLVLSSDVRVFEALNHSNVPKADLYRFLEPWLGKSLVTSHGERWTQLRKIATPAFHFQILEDFVPIFEEQTDILISKLRESGVGVVIDVFPLIGAFTLDVIVETAMGIHVGAQEGKGNAYLDNIIQIVGLIDRRSLNPIYHPNWVWKLSSIGKRHDQCLKVIQRFVDNVIEERRKYLLKIKENGGVTNGTKKRMALLDTLLHSTMDGKPLSNKDISGEVNTFTFAGHDTSKSTISFLLYQLAKHPDVQQKLYDEIHELIIEPKNNKLNIRLINSLSYLDLCVRESLRLLPPVPIVGKRNPEEIKVDDVTIPANSIILTMMMANHLNPKFFPEPDKFWPERFTEELSVNERHPYVYAPFSVGLRNCVGKLNTSSCNSEELIKVS